MTRLDVLAVTSSGVVLVAVPVGVALAVVGLVAAWLRRRD